MLLGAALAAFALPANGFELRARAIPLSEENPSLDRLGPLTFKGALALSGSERAFGGLSGLLLEPDGRFLAVTDQAHWFRGRIERDGTGKLTGIAEAELLPMLDGNLRPVRIGRPSDAESLARLPDGRLLVGFERWHRLRVFASPEAGAQFFPNPPGIATLPANSGLESITVLADGRILAVTEARGDDDTSRAWIGTPDGRTWQERRYRPGPDFVAVDAAALPGGGALVLERRVSLLTGFTSRIVHVSAAALEKPVLEPVELATIGAPLAADNYEGIAVARRDDGALDVAIVSDDNFSLFQRNILMLFRLEQDALSRG